MATATKPRGKKRRVLKVTKFDRAAGELRRLRKKHGGRLDPPAVVEAASDPDNPLHSQFTWDDTAAAHAHRLWQARQLIARVHCYIPQGSGREPIMVRAYHALRSDDGGYRHTRDIMAGPDLRESLLSQLADDLSRVRERYSVLKGIADTRKLFDVIEEFVGKRKESA